MMGKSYVTMEQQRCLVCGQDFDTGALLLDRRLRDRFERTTLTGMGLCAEHQELYDKGYVALVGIDPEKSGKHGDTLHFDAAYRTGRVAHLRFEVWERMLNRPLAQKDRKPLPMVFVDDEVITLLGKRNEEAESGPEAPA